MVAPPEPAPAARLPPAAATEVMLGRFSMVAAWWWLWGLLPGFAPVAAAVPGGGGICMTPGRMGMAGGGMLLCEPSWLDPEPFCRCTMLGGALSTLELRGGGKRESGGASGRGGPPALGGGGGIPVNTKRQMYFDEKGMRHSSLPLHHQHNVCLHILNGV